MGASLTTKTRSRGRRTGGTYRPMAEINVTPFVDVMLVLLIVFMVAAPLLTAGVSVDLPDARASSIHDSDDKPIEITVDKSGQVYIGESEIDGSVLVDKLKAMTEGNNEQRIYIRGDQGLAYGKVMDVIAMVNGAGFRKVALITNNQGQ